MHHRRVVHCGLALAVFLQELSGSVLPTDDLQPRDGITDTLSMHDVGCQVRQLGPDPARAAFVLVLLSTECPLANSYLATLNRLHDRCSSLNDRVTLIGFISDRSVTRQDAVHHAEQFEIRFHVILDGSGELAALLQPTHTPEAFVRDAAGHIAYRGRIDDTYPQLGKRRLQPHSREVDTAIRALVRGLPVKTTYAKPVGCLFEQPDAPTGQIPVTFNREIAPIVHANCTSCHCEGQVAPFPLKDV